jgi:hypothetical protein
VAGTVTVDGVHQHLVALQSIAERNGGCRASGTPGHEESVEYVVDRLTAAGFDVVVQAVPSCSPRHSPSGSSVLSVAENPKLVPTGLPSRRRHRSSPRQGVHWTLVQLGGIVVDLLRSISGDTAAISPAAISMVVGTPSMSVVIPAASGAMARPAV